jgi:hypothetical protein
MSSGFLAMLKQHFVRFSYADFAKSAGIQAQFISL